MGQVRDTADLIVRSSATLTDVPGTCRRRLCHRRSNAASWSAETAPKQVTHPKSYHMDAPILKSTLEQKQLEAGRQPTDLRGLQPACVRFGDWCPSRSMPGRFLECAGVEDERAVSCASIAI